MYIQHELNSLQQLYLSVCDGDSFLQCVSRLCKPRVAISKDSKPKMGSEIMGPDKSIPQWVPPTCSLQCEILLN